MYYIYKEPEDENKDLDFGSLVLVFLVGALSFAVALSYNNFAQALISKYSFGNGITATLINLFVFTGIALIILYIAWKNKPQAVKKAIVN